MEPTTMLELDLASNLHVDVHLKTSDIKLLPLPLEVLNVEIPQPLIPALTNAKVEVKEEVEFSDSSNVDFYINPRSPDITAEVAFKTKVKTKSKSPRKVKEKERTEKGSSPEKVYYCPVCRKKFAIKWNLQAHIRVHSGEKPFSCSECTQRFRQYAHLQKHMRSLHPGSTMPPPPRMVYQKIPQIDALPEEEVKPKDPYEKFNLRECEVRLTRWDLDNDMPISSHLVLQKFKSMASHRKNLLLEIQTEEGDCVVDMDTDLLWHFLQPMENFSEPSCTMVPTKRTTRPGPKSTKLRYKRERTFKCDICERTFSHQASLITHTSRWHSTESQDNVLIGEEKKLQLNIALDNIPKPKPRGGSKVVKYSCTICGRKFGRPDLLQKHHKLHTGKANRAFHCPTCFKFFNSENYLSIHMRIHTGEKPYECSICGKRFIQSATLKQHMRLHTGEKPYACDKCDMRFRQSCSLLNHAKKHQ